MDNKPTKKTDGKKNRPIVELPVNSVLGAFYRKRSNSGLKFKTQNQEIELGKIVELEVGQVRAVCNSKDGQFMVELTSLPGDPLNMKCRIINLKC